MFKMTLAPIADLLDLSDQPSFIVEFFAPSRLILIQLLVDIES